MPDQRIQTPPSDQRSDENLCPEHLFDPCISSPVRKPHQFLPVPPELPAGDKKPVRHTPEAVDPAAEGIIICVLDHEDIDKRPAFRIAEVLTGFDARTLPADAREQQAIICRLLRRMNPVLTSVFLSEQRDEPIVIRARHVDVDVIVPRYHSVPAHSAERRASAEFIGKTVPVAEIRDIIEDFLLRLLQCMKRLLIQCDRLVRMNMFKRIDCRKCRLCHESGLRCAGAGNSPAHRSYRKCKNFALRKARIFFG